MIRRAIGAGAATLAFALSVGAATAAAPEGPRLAVVKVGLEPPRLELITADETGALPSRLAGGGALAVPYPFPFAAPAWTADGSGILFTAEVLTPKKRQISILKIFFVGAEGKGLRPIRGTENGFNPTLAPDGHTLAFARFRHWRPGGRSSKPTSGSTLWLTDLSGSAPRQLTPWRPGLEVTPSSFSPDGTLLAISRNRPGPSPTEALALRLDGTGSVLLTRNGAMPTYSPDGTRLALIRTVRRAAPGTKGERGKGLFGPVRDLYVTDADGTDPRRLTNSPWTLELWPSWDPSSERLAFSEIDERSFEGIFGPGNGVSQINADGSCPTRILFAKNASFYGPVWQPGLGREAGPIAC